MASRKPRRGRPPLLNARARVLQLRVTELEFERWSRAAELLGLSLSDFQREALDDRADRAELRRVPKELS